MKNQKTVMDENLFREIFLGADFETESIENSIAVIKEQSHSRQEFHARLLDWAIWLLNKCTPSVEKLHFFVDSDKLFVENPETDFREEYAPGVIRRALDEIEELEEAEYADDDEMWG